MRLWLILAFLFYVGSMLGWVLELVFRRFFSGNNPERKWINPGFLVGPYIPLYGFSLCILFLLAGCETLLPIENEGLRQLVLFLIMAICVTALEYVVGLLCVRVMKVKLWDYSNNRGNIQGIICPLFSFFWMLLSAFYYFLIHPHILEALYWLAENLTFSFAIGLFFGVFLVDVAYSTQILVKIKSYAHEHQIVVRYEELKEQIRESRARREAKARFFLNMRGGSLLDQLAEYEAKMKRDVERLRTEILNDIEEKREQIESKTKK